MRSAVIVLIFLAQLAQGFNQQLATMDTENNASGIEVSNSNVSGCRPSRPSGKSHKGTRSGRSGKSAKGTRSGRGGKRTGKRTKRTTAEDATPSTEVSHGVFINACACAHDHDTPCIIGTPCTPCAPCTPCTACTPAGSVHPAHTPYNFAHPVSCVCGQGLTGTKRPRSTWVDRRRNHRGDACADTHLDHADEDPIAIDDEDVPSPMATEVAFVFMYMGHFMTLYGSI